MSNGTGNHIAQSATLHPETLPVPEPGAVAVAQQWHALGASVCGAGHRRSGRPNQDALHRWPPEGRSLPLVLAVADGHGSAPHFRSHLGARMAVYMATALAWQVGAMSLPAGGLSAVRDLACHGLPRRLVQAWQKTVNRHWQENPPSAAEIDMLQRRAGSGIMNRIAENPPVAYGATLLLLIIAPHFHFYLQLGDGNILLVSQEGQTTPLPIPPDLRLVANQTTSLCGRDAWRDCRSYFQPAPARNPGLILLATDGYANSFQSEADFWAVGGDLLRELSAHGPLALHQQLPGWLDATSRAGSGDDITVALAWPHGVHG